MYDYTEEEIRMMKATARGKGAVGVRAIVPRYVHRIASMDDRILDYGSGYGVHVDELRRAGLDVACYDFGLNTHALRYQYDIVYASNVLNIQQRKEGIAKVVHEVHRALRPGGVAVLNYPEAPRHSHVYVDEVESILRSCFEDVARVAGSEQAPVWKCIKKEHNAIEGE